MNNKRKPVATKALGEVTQATVTVVEDVPIGTPYSALTPAAIREECTRVNGPSMIPLTIKQCIDKLMEYHALQQILEYQNTLVVPDGFSRC